MMRSLWTAATGMVAQQLNIDVISHNLANVNTTGFKKSRAEFEDLIYQNMRIAGTVTGADAGQTIPTGIQVGLGVRPTTVHKFFSRAITRTPATPWIWPLKATAFSESW